MKYPFFFLLFCASFHIQAQVIYTIAGTGASGYLDGPASTAVFNEPNGLALDSDGNLYVSDLTNPRIRKISPSLNGTVSTVAGDGTYSYSGDGGPAINAEFKTVFDIAVDKQGNLYLADAANSRIRKVTTDGIIHTIAGTGVAGYNGDGIPASAALLNTPAGIAVDDTGTIYLNDARNYRLRCIDTFGIIHTIAGNGTNASSGDGGPATAAEIRVSFSVRVDQFGNLYFLDSLVRIRKISTGGIITTIAGNGMAGNTGDGGPATSASISGNGLTVDAMGNIFFTDPNHSVVREVEADGNIHTVAGTGVGGHSGDGGAPLLARLSLPVCLAVNDDGDLFISEQGSSVIRVITTKSLYVQQLSDLPYGLSVVPNPADGPLMVTVKTKQAADANIYITDINGRVADSYVQAANTTVRSPCELPPGTYLFTAIAGDKKYTQQVIVK